MINTIEEFSKEHPKAVIVNYNIAEKFDYGLTYRTSCFSLEKFRKNKGKYIKYPLIQPYLKLSKNSNYELFILLNNKAYELESYNNNYRIKRELTNINPNLFMDEVFFKKAHEPKIMDEEILLIEE